MTHTAPAPDLDRAASTRSTKAYQGRTVPIAGRDTAENARIVAVCRSALDARNAPAAVLAGAPGPASR
ncbi:hypothetical protein ABZ383_03410 [Streptomyces sp. NPDC005900]|uniref:hypothetical protein n=1 Tax=Streptomyces sp. NPDC005900 TaxID=3154569 RepID=UPI00340BED7B